MVVGSYHSYLVSSNLQGRLEEGKKKVMGNAGINCIK
jgi:hypothetical protein